MSERTDPLADLFPMIPPRNQEPGTQQAWELELARMQSAARAEALEPIPTAQLYRAHDALAALAKGEKGGA